MPLLNGAWKGWKSAFYKDAAPDGAGSSNRERLEPRESCRTLPRFAYFASFAVSMSVAVLVETTSVPALFDPAVTNKLFPFWSVNPFVVANVWSL
jgi:hypothetical protein